VCEEFGNNLPTPAEKREGEEKGVLKGRLRSEFWGKGEEMT